MIRRLASFASAVAVRTIGAVGGAIGAYGATGMFTSGGFGPPNAIVEAGAAVVALVAAALWLRERRVDGLWPALLIIAVPYAAYAIGSSSLAECAPDHPPITSVNPLTCSPAGTHAIAIVAPIIAVIALVLLVRDVRALSRGLRPNARRE